MLNCGYLLEFASMDLLNYFPCFYVFGTGNWFLDLSRGPWVQINRTDALVVLHCNSAHRNHNHSQLHDTLRNQR